MGKKSNEVYAKCTELAQNAYGNDAPMYAWAINWCANHPGERPTSKKAFDIKYLVEQMGYTVDEALKAVEAGGTDMLGADGGTPDSDFWQKFGPIFIGLGALIAIIVLIIIFKGGK